MNTKHPDDLCQYLGQEPCHRDWEVQAICIDQPLMGRQLWRFCERHARIHQVLGERYALSCSYEPRWRVWADQIQPTY